MARLKGLMLDLETLGTSDNALITTVSAVQFDLESGLVGKQFEMAINWKEQEKNNAIIDACTVNWWLKQNPQALSAMMRLEQQPLKYFFTKFNEFLNETFGDKLNDVQMWGNGVTFDNILIRNLYKRHDEEFPLPYWCDVDVRTLLALCPVNVKKQVDFVDTEHKGIDDCLYQIKYCTLANKLITKSN